MWFSDFSQTNVLHPPVLTNFLRPDRFPLHRRLLNSDLLLSPSIIIESKFSIPRNNRVVICKVPLRHEYCDFAYFIKCRIWPGSAISLFLMPGESLKIFAF